MTKHFFSKVRQFYMTVVKTMIAIFPFNDPTLKAMWYLSPATKARVSFSEVQMLGGRFLNLARNEQVALCQFWESMETRKVANGSRQFKHLCMLSSVVLSLPHRKDILAATKD